MVFCSGLFIGLKNFKIKKIKLKKIYTLNLIIFLVLLISKGISRTVKYSGLGKLDTLFGFLFGFVRSYIICVCLFSAVDIVYNSKKWPVDAKKSFTFSYVEKGSNYLIKEFPNEKNYEDAKDKVQEL